MKSTWLRSGLLLVLLAVAGMGRAQENRFKVSLLGGYEYFPNGEYPVKENGYSVGAELDYCFMKKFYLAASLHFGCNPGKTGKFSNVGDELTAPTYEYTGVLGVGYDLVSTARHTVYAQAGAGVSYINEKRPEIDYSQRPDVHTFTKDNWLTRFTGLCSVGYDYRIAKNFSIGINYSAWLIPSRIRNAANVKLTVEL